MDNRRGKPGGLYPLMDHDHAFSADEDIPSQTSELDETLQQAAYEAISHAGLDFSKVMGMKKPGELEDEEWAMVLRRCEELQQRLTK